MPESPAPTISTSKWSFIYKKRLATGDSRLDAIHRSMTKRRGGRAHFLDLCFVRMFCRRGDWGGSVKNPQESGRRGAIRMLVCMWSALFAGVAPAIAAEPAAQPYDLWIKGGLVHDGG